MFESFRVRRRVQELEDDFAKLRRDYNSLELEWNNTLDKLRAMMGRIAKRAEVAEKAAQPSSSEEAGATPPAAGARFLTPRQLQIQQQILRRRANGNGGQ